VYHLAALNGTQKFYSIPWRVLRDSTLPTIHLLDRYAGTDIDYFFYAGSSEAYAGTITTFGWDVPTSEDVPLTIDNPLNLRWSYGGSKLHGELACIAAAGELNVPVAIGRLHNAYGPSMGNHHIIPDFIHRAKERQFQLFGYENTRSFIYVDDAITSIIAVAENAKGEIINIGGPDEFTMLEIGNLLMELGGWKGEIELQPAPEGSVLRRAPNISKLRSLVDVESFVPLREGLQRTLDNYLGAK
jgi:nucleoside-diphosphate-sugar epimerase